MHIRIGLGFDSHAIGDGGPLVLGGVRIGANIHLIGHSDADVLLHAITDAICGAAGLPDIGQLFPNDDPANKNRDSADFLAAAHAAAGEAGYRLINLDCVVHLQQPKLSPHKAEIIERIAAILDVAPAAIGLKAKTGEGIGDVGAGRLAQAQCVVLMERVV